MRGYGKSTPLTPEEVSCKVTPSELHRTHTNDFFQFLNFVVKDLQLAKRSADGTGGITILFWSKGGSLALGLYYFATASDAALMDEWVSSIILYEPPASAVFGQPQDPTAIAILHKEVTDEDPGLRFGKYASGFFRNPPKYLADKGGEPVLEYYRSGIFEPEFQAKAKKASERDDMQAKLHWSLADEEDAREAAAHQAVEKIAHSSLKRVGIMWGSQGPPASLLGSWLMEKWLLEAGAKDQVRTKQVEEGNHFIHYYRPQEFWDVVLELSA
jgi:pimeloyl-ACP methyl ester carboxylesterase